MRYRIGIDVGDRSVGLAAIEFDDAGFPIKSLSLVTYRHDGGLDPTTNKNPQSRKATAGIARRTRRMHRQRKKRLKNLDFVLQDLGYKVPHQEEAQTYEAWQSRTLLSTHKIQNQEALEKHLVRAVRHIARHRGWRNPWWRFHHLQNAPVPSKSMENILATAQNYWPDKIFLTTTIGEIGGLASRNDILLRPRTNNRDGALQNQGTEAVLSDRVRQEDLYYELTCYWKKQNLPREHFESIARALFEQVRPYVPQDNVGKDPLPGQKKKNRASRSSLEFIEFRIVQAVANLRVREGHTNRCLTDSEFDAAVDYLLKFSEDKPPTWGDVAEVMGVPANRLVAPVIDDVKLNVAPYDKSSHYLLKKFSKKTEVYRWWQKADLEQRSQLVRFLSDTTDETLAEADASGLTDIFESWPEKEREILESLDFEAGRAAYSIDSLKKLSIYMRENYCDLYTARKAVFGVTDDWQPPRENLDVQTGQPTVDRVLTIVRRFVLACERKWGSPENIVIEHVRTGLMGPAARVEFLHELAKNRDANERIRTELRDGNRNNPSRADVRRQRIIQNQDSRCLYCGAALTFESAQLDHIVPRAGGGSSRIDNLVAVCTLCNSQKRDTPFAVWAENSKRKGVSVAEAVDRLWSFDKVGVFKGVSGKRLKQQIERRLKQTEKDTPIDERSLASTAYSAVTIRQRLETYFDKNDKHVSVDVYSGSMTRGSRRAGGIDERLLLRGQRDKNRFDVRHHAIDAAVLTLLNRSVALTLEQRRLLKEERDFSSYDNNWREFSGLDAVAQKNFWVWKKTCNALGDLLAEAIADDKIPVINPLRLTPKNGAVHKDTITAVHRKILGDSWTKDEIERVQDPETYLALRAELGQKKQLESNNKRTIFLSEENILTAEHNIVIFTEKAASILVGTGAAKIGDSLHHARLYAWKDSKGKINVGMLRVFGAELPWLMKKGETKDVLTVPIHPGSQSYRDLLPSLASKIASGNAQEIGWIKQNDEIEINVKVLISEKNELAEFLKIFPENRWRLDGFYNSRQLRIRPLLLSSEEIPYENIAIEFGEDKADLVKKILEKGTFPAINLLLGSGAKIMRRDPLGNPRWRSQNNNPKSIDILKNASERLGN